MEKWLGETEHLHRLADHSERAVRSAEFSVARHRSEQQHHTIPAHSTAESLSRAGELWRSLGSVHGVVRALPACGRRCTRRPGWTRHGS